MVVGVHCHGESCIHTGTRILSSRHDLEAPDHNSSRSIWNNQLCDNLQQEELQVIIVSHDLLHSYKKSSSSLHSYAYMVMHSDIKIFPWTKWQEESMGLTDLLMS